MHCRIKSFKTVTSKKKNHNKLSDLAVAKAVVFSPLNSCDMFIVVVPLVQWRRSGQSRGALVLRSKATWNVGSTGFTVNVPGGGMEGKVTVVSCLL